MSMNAAKTKAETEVQTFTVPSYDRWYEFAHLLDGYTICEEMGVSWGAWREEHLQKLDSDPNSLTILDARLLLFFEARAMRFVEGYEPVKRVKVLLALIALKKDNPDGEK